MGKMKELYIELMNEKRGIDDMDDDELFYERDQHEKEFQEYLKTKQSK